MSGVLAQRCRAQFLLRIQRNLEASGSRCGRERRPTCRFFNWVGDPVAVRVEFVINAGESVPRG
jgi:hypothetical protein